MGFQRFAGIWCGTSSICECFLTWQRGTGVGTSIGSSLFGLVSAGVELPHLLAPARNVCEAPRRAGLEVWLSMAAGWWRSAAEAHAG